MAEPQTDKERRWKVLRKRLLIAAAVLVAIGASVVAMATFLTEYWWFDHLGFGSVFVTVLLSRAGIGLTFGTVAFVLLSAHILLIRKFSKPRQDWTVPTAEGPIDLQQLVNRVATPVVVVGAFVVAIVMGIWAASHWEEFLRLFNRTPFGDRDPVLGYDIGFYFFVLPSLEFTQEWLIYLTGLCPFLSAIVYFFRGAITVPERYPEMSHQVRGHLLFGIACVVLVIGWGFRVEMFETLFSKRGYVDGAGFSDVYANLVAYRALLVACIAVALFLIALIWRKPASAKKATLPPAIALASLVALYAIGVFGAPYVVQSLVVTPNELDKEMPYLRHSIAGTRKAYALDKIERKEFPATDNLVPADLRANRTTIDNIKLWDPRPLRDAYRQLQAIRLYYGFPHIGIDRYRVHNRYMQVMLSGREFVYDQLPTDAQRWVNRHLLYTHGYGVVLSPVNQVVGAGMPDLWIKDIPPISPPRFGFTGNREGAAIRISRLRAGGPAVRAGLQVGDLIVSVDGLSQVDKVVNVAGQLDPDATLASKVPSTTSHRFTIERNGQEQTIPIHAERFGVLDIERPEIYYGLTTDDYVVVRTKEQEFDYPKGEDNVYSTYAGKGGVPLSSFFRRLLFSVRFGDLKLLFTSQLKDESVVLFNRAIQHRVHTVAPFLVYDQEPYMVVADGRLFWIQDAYTVSYRHPYSKPTSLGRRARINYIRNSVKVVVDAYHGRLSFYVWDNTDPMIQTYSKIFPQLFKPKSTLPESLRSHVRYPKDLFAVQAEMYASFHMTDPRVFYNQEDKYAISRVLEQTMRTYDSPEQTPQPGLTMSKVTQATRMQPYYMIMRLPGQQQEQFQLMVPYTPTNKDNMVAWMTASCDGENYGKLLIYVFPKNKVVLGPMQVHALIDQDNDISEWITLRDQKGSQVFRGDLLVIPIEDAILYVEPLYLEATRGQLPELKKVIVAFGKRLAMRDDLESALNAVFGVDREPGPTAKPQAKPDATDAGGESQPAEVRQPAPLQGDLAGTALQHYRAAQQKLKQGDWAGYGIEQQKLRAALEQLAGQLQPRLAPPSAQ